MRHQTIDYLTTHAPQFYASPLPPPPPPNSNEKPAHTNTFVHKLYNMVIDTHYQHLISWSYLGSSFIVCNLLEFSKDVLPKHFKHNNFSSFVRQLNMYGFHKVNKSPRGHRTLAENQIWEFSHQQFMRNRPDLLDDIKRKTLESDRKDNNNNNNNNVHDIMLMQASQSELVQQMQGLYQNFSQALKDLHIMRQNQEEQAKMLKSMSSYISQQNGGHLPQELNFNKSSPVFISTTPVQNSLGPPSPSPSMFLPDDEIDSLYSNRLYPYR